MATNDREKEGDIRYFCRVQIHPVGFNSRRKYFYILKELGLIQSVGFVPGKAPFRKHMFAVVKGTEADPRWARPQIELYPATKYGKKGYLKLKKRGLRPRLGRRAAYRK